MDFLVIDDDKTFREATCILIDDEDHYAEGAPTGAYALQRLKETKFDAALLDLRLGAEDGLEILQQIVKGYPQLPVVMFTAEGNVKTAVEAMRRGAVDFLEKPFQRKDFLMVLARLNKIHQMGQRIERLEREVIETKSLNGEPIFDFTTLQMKQMMEVLMRAAPTPASVLILGESGTGKSVAARAVHQNSLCANGPFVTVSCPSLSKELLESELFGSVRGAYTGSVKDHWGKVKAAEGGTLFLDEIGDLPMEIQPKLLRLLQEREYERLGENVIRKANVRVVAATNRDLKKRVAEGAFREDLYFRLNVISVEMPPLRARQEDLVRFAEHYAAHFGGQCGRPNISFAPEAVTCLRTYPWPGNLREMRNAIERAVILAKGDQILPEDFPGDIRTPNLSAHNSTEAVGTLISLDQLEEMHIRKVLDVASSLGEAATILGIDQATLYRKRKKMGL